MADTTRPEAVRAAADRLAQIERWCRWTAIAATVAASLLAVLAALALIAGYDYLALKRGMREAQASLARDLRTIPLRPPASKPTTSPRGIARPSTTP